MKIAFSLRPNSGPSGGGISFLTNLTTELLSKGNSVFYDLREPELDLILIMDPRWRHSNNAFNSKEIFNYVYKKNPNVIIVHRINECDERKDTNFMNKKLRQINFLADSTIFVSNWLLTLDVINLAKNHEFDIVIRNGANKSIFNNINFIPWDRTGKLKLVTHHWSNNRNKGFDIYEHLDLLLGQEKFRSKFDFTYIGNLPKSFKFKYSTHIKPLEGTELAAEIKKNHAYLTASINEPGSNHQNEGGSCGLPILYRNSGSLPEYCNGYGVRFDETNFESKLLEFRSTYTNLVRRMDSFPNTAEVMVSNYIKYFNYLLENRAYILNLRKFSRFSKSALRLNFPI
jgi:hypothetical protein